MALIVPGEEADEVISRLSNMNLKSYLIGKITTRVKEEEAILEDDF
jgi:phosphoribosylaminoimidazole (AIR) synthetase